MAPPRADEPLVIDGDGLLCIPDHKGVVHRYLAELAPEGLDDWAVVLRRLDDQKGDGPYRVARTPGGRWTCECLDRFYRAGKEARRCKHVYCLQKLYLQIQRLTYHARDDHDEAKEAG